MILAQDFCTLTEGDYTTCDCENVHLSDGSERLQNHASYRNPQITGVFFKHCDLGSVPVEIFEFFQI